MDLTGRSHQQTSAAIAILVNVGILRKTSNSLRNRCYEAPEIIAAFSALERQLASPDGDTKISEPTRPVPAAREMVERTRTEVSENHLDPTMAETNILISSDSSRKYPSD